MYKVTLTYDIDALLCRLESVSFIAVPLSFIHLLVQRKYHWYSVHAYIQCRSHVASQACKTDRTLTNAGQDEKGPMQHTMCRLHLMGEVSLVYIILTCSSLFMERIKAGR